MKKELEDDHKAAEGTVYGPGIADRLNVETYDESLNQMLLSIFPQKWGFGVTTVRGAQRREFALHPG